MKDELQTKLVEILTSIQSAAGKAGDFAMAQLPDIAQSYVMYGRVTTLISSLALLIAACALFAIALWAYRTPWNNSPWDFERDAKRSDSNHVCMVIPSILGSTFLIVAFASFDWLVWLAPKVWLLKEIAHLLK